MLMVRSQRVWPVCPAGQALVQTVALGLSGSGAVCQQAIAGRRPVSAVCGCQGMAHGTYRAM